VGRAFFPLDERIGLLAGSAFSPRLHACLVRLGTELPFERVPELARMLLGVVVSADTVRRLTEAAGAAQVAREAAACQRLRREAPEGPPGPAVQQLSADGAMVPLRGGEWAEVRTIALGRIEGNAAGEPHATDLRYFSRLCAATAFLDWVELPLYEAGTAQAETVVAVQDGAEWLCQLLAAHRPDAIRILDFPHAAEHLARAAQAAYGMGTPAVSEWLGTWLHELKHGDPAAVIAAVRALPASTPEAVQVREGVAAYLTRRRSQIAYAQFRAQGYPIGSGMVESANKLVVEARLKGSGMHWARSNVTPMLALRAIACNGTWEQTWPAIWRQLQQQDTERRHQRWKRRREAQADPEPAPLPLSHGPILAKEPPTIVAGRPTVAHPWARGYHQRSLARARASAKS
jgi:hypothetical protein